MALTAAGSSTWPEVATLRRENDELKARVARLEEDRRRENDELKARVARLEEDRRREMDELKARVARLEEDRQDRLPAGGASEASCDKQPRKVKTVKKRGRKDGVKKGQRRLPFDYEMDVPSCFRKYAVDEPTTLGMAAARLLDCPHSDLARAIRCCFMSLLFGDDPNGLMSFDAAQMNLDAAIEDFGLASKRSDLILALHKHFDKPSGQINEDVEQT
jgi:hypothetical protein